VWIEPVMAQVIMTLRALPRWTAGAAGVDGLAGLAMGRVLRVDR
jgi:hypothetical protein